MIGTDLLPPTRLALGLFPRGAMTNLLPTSYFTFVVLIFSCFGYWTLFIVALEILIVEATARPVQ